MIETARVCPFRTLARRRSFARGVLAGALCLGVLVCGCSKKPKLKTDVSDNPTHTHDVSAHIAATRFVPGESYDIDRIELLFSTAGANDVVTLDLQSDATASPSVIYNSMSASPSQGGGWTKFPFNNFSVSSGTTYYIRASASSGTQVSWSMANPSAYGSAEAVVDGSATTGASFLFKVYGR